MNIRIFSYIQVPCDRPPHQIKKYLHIVKLQVFWKKELDPLFSWNWWHFQVIWFRARVSSLIKEHHCSSLFLSLTQFQRQRNPKINFLCLSFIFAIFCVMTSIIKKKIFSKIGVKEKLSNHLNWMELLMIIFAEYTSVSWELGEDKLDLLIDNSTRPLLFFQHGIFVDFKHDCISRQFSVLQCYPHLRFFRCAVALVWISSFILALPVIWTNVSFCHLKMRNI